MNCYVTIFLIDIKKCCFMVRKLSDWGPLSIGVHQGSILGHLLFTLYINDLPYIVNCFMDLYVDDAEMHCNHAELNEVKTRLQSDLDDVYSSLALQFLAVLECCKI